MIDPNMLMPFLQMMNKGGGNSNSNNNNMNDFQNMFSMLNQMNRAPNSESVKTDDNSSSKQNNNSMNDMMNFLPMLMQMMGGNKNFNTAPKSEPVVDDTPKDPFEPIRNIGNDNINSMLYNMMNRK